MRFPVSEACDQVVMGELKEIGGNGGVVAIASSGETAICFNNPRMYRAWRDSNGALHTAIYSEDDRIHQWLLLR